MKYSAPRARGRDVIQARKLRRAAAACCCCCCALRWQN